MAKIQYVGVEALQAIAQNSNARDTALGNQIDTIDQKTITNANAIDTEVAQRVSSANTLDSTLTNLINNEATARSNADIALQNSIDSKINGLLSNQNIMSGLGATSGDTNKYLKGDGTFDTPQTNDIFVGTQAEWEALSTAEKNEYSQANITDANSVVHVPVDVIADGNMNPVTSNAVHDALNKSVTITNKTFTIPTGGYVSWGNLVGHDMPQPRLAYVRLTSVSIDGADGDCFVDIKSSKYGAHAVFIDVDTGLPLAGRSLTISGTAYYI